jgi:uncharacterized oxidoreductase
MEYPVLRIQPGPDNYYCHAGAINHLYDFFSKEQLSRALWIHGKRSGEAVGPYLPKEVSDGYLLEGHCTHETVDALTARAKAADLVIGTGGGTVLDTAKALSIASGKPFVSIPTIAATCAGWTPLSVWYTPQGKALGYELFPHGAFLVLVDPQIILDAPSVYLQAGVADTIAKWYEARILSEGRPILPLTAELGVLTAKRIVEVLLEEGPAAFKAQKDGKLDPVFIKIVDAVIAGGGLVGGLGEKYTRVAAAHALHNGMSVLSETHDKLHGLKVAYGVLVQAVLMNDEDELVKLRKKFLTMGLPTSFRDLGVDPTDEAKIDKVVAASLAPHESMHLLPFPVDAKMVKDAIAKVESLSTKEA